MHNRGVDGIGRYDVCEGSHSLDLASMLFQHRLWDCSLSVVTVSLYLGIFMLELIWIYFVLGSGTSVLPR